MTDKDPAQCRHLVGNGHKKRLCKNPPVEGDYCRTHANHPDRRVEAVQVSLHDFVQAAIMSLGHIVTDGERHADRVNAAKVILDRTGHGPAQTVTVQDSDERLEAILRARRGE